MAVLSAKGKQTPAGKAKAASTSSSSKASSIGSVVSGNGGVGSVYSNTGNTVGDKATREANGQSAQSSANDIQAAKAAGTHTSQTSTDRLSTSTQPSQAPVTTQQNQTQTNKPQTSTATTVADMSVEDWNKKTLAQQKLWMKLYPQVDISKYGREMAKGAGAKIAQQNEQPTDARLGDKPTPTQQPTAAATPTPPVNNYQDNSAERMAEINANLEAAYQQTPSTFKSREIFDAEFEYDKRNQSQKRALDDFYNRKAQETLLRSTSAQDIVASIASGKTSLEKYDLLKEIDPIKYTAVQDGLHQAQNKMKQDSNVAVANATLGETSTGTELKLPPEVEANFAAMEKAIDDNRSYYEKALSDPQLMEWKDELTKEIEGVNQLDKDIMRVRQEVADQYPGVPRSQLNAIIADRTDKYRIERGDALIKINTYQGMVNNRLEEADRIHEAENNRITQKMNLNTQRLNELGFAFQVQQYNEAPARAKEQALFEQDLQQENAVFNSNLQVDQQQQLMEQEYDFANPDWNSADPVEQNRALTMAVNRAYETFGDIIQRSPAQVVADVKKLAQEKGISLQEALQENFMSQLKEKPEYQKILNAKMGISNDPSAGMQRGKIGEWTDDNGVVHDTFGLINLNTGAVTPAPNSGSPEQRPPQTPQGTPDDVRWEMPVGTDCGEQCGERAHDAVGVGSEPGGDDSIKGRLATYTDTEPVVGGLVFFKDANPTNGHVAAVIGINGDQMTIKEANLKLDGKITVRTVPISSATGFYNNTPRANGVEAEVPSEQKSYDPNRTPDYIRYIEKGVMPTGVKESSVNGKKFIAEASEGYIAAKKEAFEQKGFTITNSDAYLSTDQETRTKVNEAVQQVPAFIETMDRLITLTEDQGTEAPRTASALEMKQLVVDAQLKAKEIYNLGVLNGPDLDLMQAIIKDPVGFGAKFAANAPLIRRDYAALLKNAKQTILSNAYGKASQVGLSPIMSGEVEDDEWNNFVNQNLSQGVSSGGGYTLQYSTPFPDADES